MSRKGVTVARAVATREVSARRQERTGGRGPSAVSVGSGKSHALVSALLALPLEKQRFALLMAEAVGTMAKEVALSESDIRNIIYRLVQAGVLQERKAPEARRELARALGPSLEEIDPVPHATVEQARRLAVLRASLLREGALSTSAIAEARQTTINNARQWIFRHRKSHRLFTVTLEGETLVPAFLLDEQFDPKAEAHQAIKALRGAGEDGWALWTWFAKPSAWLGGRIPADLLSTDSELVAESARQRAESAA